MTQGYNLSQFANKLNTSGQANTTALQSGTYAINISGNAATATSATSATSSTSASNITNAGGWSITPTGTKLFFNYNGVNVASLDSSGNFIAKANVTSFGTP
jgi:hypothetical protein